MTIGQKIKRARRRLHMPRAELARLTEISYSSISSYEADRTEPCLSYAVKIADALGIKLDYLARCSNDGK